MTNSGILVEVLFSIHRTFIKKQSALPVDSFQAETEHVQILKPRTLHPQQTKDPHAGPLTIRKQKRDLGKGKERETPHSNSTTYAETHETR